MATKKAVRKSGSKKSGSKRAKKSTVKKSAKKSIAKKSATKKKTAARASKKSSAGRKSTTKKAGKKRPSKGIRTQAKEAVRTWPTGSAVGTATGMESEAAESGSEVTDIRRGDNQSDSSSTEDSSESDE